MSKYYNDSHKSNITTIYYNYSICLNVETKHLTSEDPSHPKLSKTLHPSLLIISRINISTLTMLRTLLHSYIWSAFI
jgi:hypothetical protein